MGRQYKKQSQIEMEHGDDDDSQGHVDDREEGVWLTTDAGGEGYQPLDIQQRRYRNRFWALFLAIAGVILATALLSVDWGAAGEAFYNDSDDDVNSQTFATPPQDDDGWEEAPVEEAFESRPPLHKLIGDFQKNITGDVQSLMDFAIIGHSKCATTAHLRWIRDHPQVTMYNKEVHSLRYGRPAEMASLMYAMPAGDYKRGYKAPNDIRTPSALDSLRTYWPRTKLVIGVRHPVKWFESYYNYNSRQGKDFMRPAEEMVGNHFPDHPLFHTHLSKLGKTNVLDAGEAVLLGDQAPKQQPPRMENEVFLFEVSQPFDPREGRDVQYQKDLTKFLGLDSELGLPEKRTKPSPNLHYAIDICDGKFEELRKELIETGTTAAKWITDYFMVLDDVTVSNPDHFRELLDTWSADPCDSG